MSNGTGHPAPNLVAPRWLLERRTCDEYLRAAARTAGSLSALEGNIGLAPASLRVFLTVPGRGFSRPTMLKIRNHLGLPIACQLERARPICDVMRDELASGGDGGIDGTRTIS